MSRHPVTGMTVVGYAAPPEPETAEGDGVIEIPEEEGTPVTVLTVENGMTVYLHRERWDAAAADHYATAIDSWLNASDENFLGLPGAQHPDEWVWVSRHTLLTCMHLHDAVVMSPLAVQKQRGGKRIIVPMGDGQIEMPGHGPGKRRR
jgi:hypothetical protein